MFDLNCNEKAELPHAWIDQKLRYYLILKIWKIIFIVILNFRNFEPYNMTDKLENSLAEKPKSGVAFIKIEYVFTWGFPWSTFIFELKSICFYIKKSVNKTYLHRRKKWVTSNKDTNFSHIALLGLTIIAFWYLSYVLIKIVQMNMKLRLWFLVYMFISKFSVFWNQSKKYLNMM